MGKNIIELLIKCQNTSNKSALSKNTKAHYIPLTFTLVHIHHFTQTILLAAERKQWGVERGVHRRGSSWTWGGPVLARSKM